MRGNRGEKNAEKNKESFEGHSHTIARRYAVASRIMKYMLAIPSTVATVVQTFGCA